MTIAVFFLTALGTLACGAFLARYLELRDHALTVQRLSGRAPVQPGGRRAGEPLLIRIADEVRGRLATRLLMGLRLKESTERLLETAGLRWGAAGLLHRSAGCFLAGFGLVTVANGNSAPLVALSAGAVAGAAPVAWVRRRARLRLRQFEEQFPDCLEFISRSMRAGHAFSVSLEMVYREFSEPLSGEFRRIWEEQNLGQPLDIVLNKLPQRIPSLDAQFFVAAVLLQRRTGGNLAELLDKLAQIIRERFKLRARVRAISAQGLMSGRILSAIPACVGLLMYAVNPQYARFFIDDPMGHKLLAGAILMQLIGYLVIRKIVTIEV
jgi:tight adherence protein B